MADDNNPRNLLVIKASAGSGKTYRLALEYIRHLLFTTAEDGKTLVPRRAMGDTRLLNSHRQLLAITFTNKATDEMKGRIVDELYNLSQPGVKSNYLKGFMKDSGLDEDEIRWLARQALNEVLFDYSNFNVSTIDSFFQTILRNFARELDRDFNYDIQIEEDYAVRVAVHNFLLSLGQEGQPTQVDEWVADYQRHLIRGDAEKKNWKFFRDGGDLNRFAKKLSTELFRSRIGEIRDYLGRTDEQGRFVCDFNKIRAFKQFMHETVQRCEDNTMQVCEDLRNRLLPVSDGLGKSAALRTFLGTGTISSKTLMEATDDSKVRGQFNKAGMPDDDTISDIYRLVTRYFRLLKEKSFFQHIEDNLGLMGMLAMIDLQIEAYRHETNSILISDTNELIGTVLASGSEFVYERVGTTISNFMIDEFQDTSAKQYENFRGLLRESLAGGHFNMLIGDAKQSIYRFRNADPTVFRDRVGADFAGDINDGREAVDAGKPASTNYRSSRNIITFNNRLFSFLMEKYQDRRSVVATYSDIEQAMPDGIDTTKVPGYVRLITKNNRHFLEDTASVAPQSSDSQEGNSGDVDVTEVLPGYLLSLHERYEWGHIGILVNTHDDGDAVVKCILDYNKRTEGEKINIISGESLLLNNSPIIRRIIAMLRFIDISQFRVSEDNADNDEEQDRIERLLQRKRRSDQRLYSALNEFIRATASQPDATPLDNGALLAQCLNALPLDSGDPSADADAESLALTTLSQLLPPAGELTTLVSIVETIIAHFKRVGGSDVNREVAFLLAFQDTVMAFCNQTGGGSVREFLKYWDEKKDGLSVSGSACGDAINIMTIHAAKGLEFDCVVIPYAKWEMDGNTREKEYWMPRKEFIDVLESMDFNGMEWTADIIPPLLHIEKKTAVELCKAGAFGEKATAFINKQVDDVLIDNLNKTYVALTRPCTELHIFTDGNARTIAPLLTEFAVSAGVMTPVAGVQGWYEMGTAPTREEMDALRQKNVSSDDNRVEQTAINGYIVDEIPLQLRVRVEHAAGTSIDAGLRLHSLLSRIRDRSDVERVIDVGLKHGVITHDPDDLCGIESIRSHVLAPIMDKGSRVSAWFDPANKVYSERTITTLSTSLWDELGIQNVRPDRIIRRPDGQLIVIDYKSGQRDDKRYCRQVNNYMSKLRAVFPGVPIEGRIWYVMHDLIVDASGRVLENSLPDSASQ